MDMIVKLQGNRFLNLHSGTLFDFIDEQFCRITTPTGYPLELHGDAATSLLWTLNEVALDLSDPDEDDESDGDDVTGYTAAQGT